MINANAPIVIQNQPKLILRARRKKRSIVAKPTIADTKVAKNIA